MSPAKSCHHRPLLNSPASAPIRRRTPAFTLIELMVVVALMAVLMAIAIPAISTLSKAGGINSGGRMVADLLTVARAEALNQRTRVQVRVVTKWTTGGSEDPSAAYRKISIWKLDSDKLARTPRPADLFTQVSKWETLPAGIIIDPHEDPTTATPPYIFEPSSSPRNPGTYFLNSAWGNRIDGVSVGSATVDFAWVEFNSTGAVAHPGKTYLLVTEGMATNSGGFVYTHAGHPNWFATVITGVTGRISTLRP